MRYSQVGPIIRELRKLCLDGKHIIPERVFQKPTGERVIILKGVCLFFPPLPRRSEVEAHVGLAFVLSAFFCFLLFFFFFLESTGPAIVCLILSHPRTDPGQGGSNFFLFFSSFQKKKDTWEEAGGKTQRRCP